jgi:hypothetical protein
MSFSRSAQPPADLSIQLQSFETNLGKLEAAASGPLDVSKCRISDRHIRGLDQASALIAESLRTSADGNAPDLRWRFSSLVERFQLVKSEYLRNKAALPPPDAPPAAPHDDAAVQPQAVVLDQAEELAFLQAETDQVVRTQRELSVLGKKIGDIIDEGHTKVVTIDTVVEEAKQDMADGGAKLREAEKDQKRCIVA